MSTMLDIDMSQLDVIAGMPMLLNLNEGIDKAVSWASKNATSIDAHLKKKGVILIRGLPIYNNKEYGQVITQLFDEPLIQYVYRSTPRTEMRGYVYTATEYPATEVIPQHNENAYTNVWPMRLGFYCEKPALKNGNTPLADSRLIYDKIHSEIKEKFSRKKLMYVRNYGNADLPWTEVFQTTDKRQVEKYCNENRIDFLWIDDNQLRTKQIVPAIAKHPSTHEYLWFNQAHLFHISNLTKNMQQDLLSIYAEEDLPRNCYYGDHESLEEDVLNEIRGIYNEVTFSFSWEKGDLLLIDNMLYSHGRQTYSGDRKVLVGMACPMSWEQL